MDETPPKLSAIKTLNVNTTPVQAPIKKKLNYDDLLSNMGMTLVNGRLELYNKSKPYPVNPPPPVYRNVAEYQYQQNRSQPQQQPNRMQPQQQQSHPMTKQQYRKYLQQEYLKNQHERNRIGQIKSKKLMFSNPETAHNIHIQNTNRFFRL